MFSSSRSFNEEESIGSERKSLFSNKSDNCQMDEMKNRVAVRFLVRKSKRFDDLQQQLEQKTQQSALKTQPLPESLMYLGLAPKNGKMHNRDTVKSQKKLPDFQFSKPRIYECCYCKKVFFHKLPYRRHMIHHMKKIHWCKKCCRQFNSRIAKRRHELTCQY